MANLSRRKGVEGEREVAAIWREHGFDVRGLELQGDHTVIHVEAEPWHPHPDLRLHSEVKRREKTRPYEWMAQAESEAPAGAVPVVAFRRNRSKWYALLSLDDLARLLA